jgi:hypothetical protein
MKRGFAKTSNPRKVAIRHTCRCRIFRSPPWLSGTRCRTHSPKLIQCRRLHETSNADYVKGTPELAEVEKKLQERVAFESGQTNAADEITEFWNQQR